MGAQELCHILPRRAQHHEALGLVPEAGSFQIIIAGLAQDALTSPDALAFLKVRVSLTASFTAADTGTCI